LSCPTISTSTSTSTSAFLRFCPCPDAPFLLPTPASTSIGGILQGGREGREREGDGKGGEARGNITSASARAPKTYSIANDSDTI